MDARQIARIREAAPSVPTVEVPLFDRDVYDIEALMLVARRLVT
jgi:hypothetical protein